MAGMMRASVVTLLVLEVTDVHGRFTEEPNGISWSLLPKSHRQPLLSLAETNNIDVGMPWRLLQEVGEQHPFAYALNSPMNRVDPFGRRPMPPNETPQQPENDQSVDWSAFLGCMAFGAGPIAAGAGLYCYRLIAAPVPLPAKIALFGFVCGSGVLTANLCYEFAKESKKKSPPKVPPKPDKIACESRARKR